MNNEKVSEKTKEKKGEVVFYIYFALSSFSFLSSSYFSWKRTGNVNLALTVFPCCFAGVHGGIA